MSALRARDRGAAASSLSLCAAATGLFVLAACASTASPRDASARDASARDASARDASSDGCGVMAEDAGHCACDAATQYCFVALDCPDDPQGCGVIYCTFDHSCVALPTASACDGGGPRTGGSGRVGTDAACACLRSTVGVGSCYRADGGLLVAEQNLP